MGREPLEPIGFSYCPEFARSKKPLPYCYRFESPFGFVVPIAAALWLVGWVLVPSGTAETFTISPPVDGTGNPVCSASEEFENLANQLNPGDELILRGGVYCQTGRRAITSHGTSLQPITIRAADGEVPILTRPDDPTVPQSHNGTEVAGEHVILRGLHFRGGDIGLRIMGGSHHVTIEDCEISDTSNNALTLNSGDTHSCLVLRNHIHHTGLLDSSFGTTEGEGMYIGCNNATCIARDHRIEGNYIHHLRGTSGGGNDGIEIKYGSHGNVVRGNVIHDTTIGRQYPCIFVYGVTDPGAHSRNVVEANAVWNCGEGIQVVSDTLVQNNLILNSITGITTAPHGQVPQLRNVSIVNNTIYGHQQQGIYLRWSTADNMQLVNNAIYSSGGRALNAAGWAHPAVLIRSNYIEGIGVAIDNLGFFDGGDAAQAFSGAGSLDFWPLVGSVLIGTASASLSPGLDFNRSLRHNPVDVGAYETEGRPMNPGWLVSAGFKTGPLAPKPPMALRASSPGSGEEISFEPDP